MHNNSHDSLSKLEHVEKLQIPDSKNLIRCRIKNKEQVYPWPILIYTMSVVIKNHLTCEN